MASDSSIPQEISTAMCYKNQVLVSYTSSPAIHLYNLSSIPYTHIHSFVTHSTIISFDWGYKKDLVLACSPSHCYILQIKNNLISLVQSFNIDCCIGAFSYLNDFVLIGNNLGNVKLVNLLTGESVFNYDHKGMITGVDISLDDELMVSASLDNTCVLHKVKEQKKLRTLEFAERDYSRNLPFMGCKFSKNGSVLFTVSCDEYSYLTQWDTHELMPICTYHLHVAPIKSFTMSLDGFFLGIGTVDGWVKILNTRTMDFERKTEEFPEAISSFTFTYDSRHVVVCSGSQFRNIFNTRGEGFFSKASKIWVISIFLLWFYLCLSS